MNEALAHMMMLCPWLTAIFASIGLATLACATWALVKPFFEFLTANPLTLIVTLGSVLLLVGMTCLGYAVEPERGAFQYGGISGAALGALNVIWVFARHCIKWSYN